MKTLSDRLDTSVLTLYTKASSYLLSQGFKQRKGPNPFWYQADGNFNPYSISISIEKLSEETNYLGVEYTCPELDRPYLLCIEEDEFIDFVIFVETVKNLNKLYGYSPF